MLDSLFERFDSIIVLDTETTGIDSRTNEIIELAALRLHRDGDSYKIDMELDDLVRLSPGRKLPSKIEELTGITQEQLEQEGLEKTEVCRRFCEFFTEERTLVCAYNAQFDLCFLYRFLLQFDKASLLKGLGFLDVLTIYKDRRDYPHRLKDAIAAYNLDTQNTHRALDDTRAALDVLIAMDLEEPDIHRYIGLFGYNPKYGVSGPRISSVTYRPQSYKRSDKLYEGLQTATV